MKAGKIILLCKCTLWILLVFIRRPSILFMSVDLRQLIRQSSHITVNPTKSCTNAALINAHLYIITVTCGTSVMGGLGRVPCQERMGALCQRVGVMSRVALAHLLFHSRHSFVVPCLKRQLSEGVIYIPNWWWSSRIEAPCHVGFSHLYTLHFSLHKNSWQSSSGKMVISWAFIKITLIMNSDYVHLNLFWNFITEIDQIL